MIEILASMLALVAFLTGYLVLIRNKWEFNLKDAYRDNNILIYIVVCLYTAASFGAFFSTFGTESKHLEVAEIAISINKVLGLISIIGFHILSRRILKEKE